MTRLSISLGRLVQARMIGGVTTRTPVGKNAYWMVCRTAAGLARAVLLDDPHEELFERGGRVRDLGVGGAEPGHELARFLDLLGSEAAGDDLGDVLHLEQVLYLTELLHSAAEEDRDAVADV